MTLDVKRYPILVVDDEQDNLDAFRFNFRKTFDILTANSGPEALTILEDKDVAVVVTELKEGGNIISAMFTGRKIISGRPKDGTDRA